MVIMMKDIDDWLDRDFHKWFLRIINTKKKKWETYIVSQPVHGQKLVSGHYQWRKIKCNLDWSTQHCFWLSNRILIKKHNLIIWC